MSSSLWGRLDDVGATPATSRTTRRAMGFFTDTSVCIGCKACEVACKEWNEVPDDGYALTGMSYDNTEAARRQHLAARGVRRAAASTRPTTDLGPARHRARPGADRTPPAAPGEDAGDRAMTVRWLMSSDVCKHCTHAACLDVCPTGSLFRTEFGTVVVQPDVCNGCGYCVPACPYGVIDQRKEDGRAFKCTLCYDRLKDGQTPACAQACPTESIQFGDLDELRERADRRLAELHDKGVDVARLYGRDPDDGVGGDGAFFLLLDEPEVYGLPPDPVVTTRDLASIWKHVGAAAATLAGARGRVLRGAARGEGADAIVPERGVRVLLRPADPQDADVEDARRPALPLPRRARRRLGGAGRGRGVHRTARPRARRATRRGVGARRSARWPWSTTSAARSGSSTCCGSSSRPRRSRSARSILAPFGAPVRRGGRVAGHRSAAAPGSAGRRRRRRASVRRWRRTPAR